jgi:hypothetical protein
MRNKCSAASGYRNSGNDVIGHFRIKCISTAVEIENGWPGTWCDKPCAICSIFLLDANLVQDGSVENQAIGDSAAARDIARCGRFEDGCVLCLKESCGNLEGERPGWTEGPSPHAAQRDHDRRAQKKGQAADAQTD